MWKGKGQGGQGRESGKASPLFFLSVKSDNGTTLTATPKSYSGYFLICESDNDTTTTATMTHTTEKLHQRFSYM